MIDGASLGLKADHDVAKLLRILNVFERDACGTLQHVVDRPRHRASGHGRLGAWHAGAWFIPIVSLWLPLQNISDLARGSRAALGGGIRATWWALWIVSGLTGGIASRLVVSAHTIPSLTGALMISILSDVLSIAAAVFAWIVVARITDAIDPAYR